MLRDKSVIPSEPYLSSYWEQCKKSLNLESFPQSDPARPTSIEFINDQRILNSVICSIIDSLKGSTSRRSSREIFSQSTYSTLKILQYLLSKSERLIVQNHLESLLFILSSASTILTDSAQVKIKILTTLIDIIITTIGHAPEKKESVQKFFEFFKEFLSKFNELSLKDLLQISVSSKESVLNEISEYEKNHFLEYVLLVILSLCKYHDLKSDFITVKDIFEQILNFLVTLGGMDDELVPSKCSFLVNNMILALNILMHMSKEADERVRIVISSQENFKAVFAECAKCFHRLSNIEDYRGESFKNDPSALGKLFRVTFELFSLSVSAWEIQDSIIEILFNLILRENHQLRTGWVKLKAYIIEFLTQYFLSGSRSRPIEKMLKIEGLVLNVCFFLEKNESFKIKWENLWKKILGGLKKTHVIKTISHIFEENCKDSVFLTAFLLWCDSLDDRTASCLLESKILTSTFDEFAKDECENREIFFQIISKCLEYKEIPDPKALLDRILTKILPKQDLSEYCETWIALLLQIQDEDVLIMYVNHWKTEKVQSDSLINALIKALRNRNNRKVIQKSFLEKGFLHILEDWVKINATHSEIPQRWQKTLECIELLLLDKEPLDHLKFSFFKIIQTFRSLKSSNLQKEIILRTIRFVKHFTISKDYVKIITPQAIPLLLEFISYPDLTKTEKLRIKFETLLKTQTNFNQAVKFGLTSIFLYHFTLTDIRMLWRTPEKLISRAISHKFSIFELSELIKALNSIESYENQLFILDILYNSLQDNESSISPSYFCFNFGQFLSLKCPNNDLQLVNEYSVAFWLLPECRSASALCNLKCSADDFIVRMENKKIVVDIGENSYTSEHDILLNTWNLISINFKFTTMAKVMKSKRLTIDTNLHRSHFKDYHKLGFSQKNIVESITIGGKKSDSFIGKVSGLYFFKKRLKKSNLSLLHKLGEKYSILSLPYNIKQSDIKLLQELKENVILCCTSTSIYNLSTISPEIFCDIFGGCSVFEVIQAYNPRRFLIEVLEICKDSIELLVRAYEIILRLIYGNQLLPGIDCEFFRFLSYQLQNFTFNDRVNEIFVMIIKSCPLIFREEIFESYYQKIANFSGKKKYISTVFKIFQETYPVSKENLYKLSKLLKGIEVEQLVMYFKEYFGEDNENKKTEYLAYVLIEILNDEDIDNIRAILEILQSLPFSLGYFTKISTVLLHLLEKIESFDIQSLIITTICLRKLEKEWEIEQEQLEILLYMIDEVLPNKLSWEFAEFLLKKAFEEPNVHKLIKKYFMSIVLKRIGYISDEKAIESINGYLRNNQGKLIDYVYSRDIFPNFLVDLHRGMKFTKQVNELTELIFVNSIKSNLFEKMSIFFKEIPNIECFYKIFVVSKSKENLYSFFVILKNIPSSIIQEHFEIYQALIDILSHENYIKHYYESINPQKILFKSSKTPMKKQEKHRDRYKFILIEYFQILIRFITTFPNHSEPVKHLTSVLSKGPLSFFIKSPKYPLNDKGKCENLTALYLFTELLPIFSFQPEKFLHEIILTWKIFDRLRLFFTWELNKEILEAYDKVPSNYAILSSQSVYDPSEFPSVDSKDQLDFSFSSQYEQVLNSIALITEAFTNGKPFAEISEDFLWQMLYEKLSNILKRFKKSVHYAFRNSIETSQQLDLKTFPMKSSEILMQVIDDPWVAELLESQNRRNYKNALDYIRFKNGLKYVEFILNGEQGELRVRQVYDRLYRWPLIKAVDSSKTPCPKFCEDGEKSQTEPIHSNKSSMATLSTKTNTKIFEKPTKRPIELIKIQGSYFGTFKLTDRYFEMKFTGAMKPKKLYIGSALECTCRPKVKWYIFKFSEISEILRYKFLHQDTAIELILLTGKSYLINFFENTVREDFLGRFKHQNEGYFLKSSTNYLESTVTDWKQLKISNFEYLMILNKLGNRSSNDLSQYPVFPWVLKDNSIKNFDLISSDSLRDFKYPMGAQSKDMRISATKKLKMFEEEMHAQHYGSHYSCPGIVTYYMLRLQPYTQQAIEIQSGSFDVADRLFFSLEVSWNSCMSQSGDLKELIPELFYQYFTVTSCSDQFFGCTQSKKNIIHVDTPTWAVSNWDFIKKHRMLLESSFVSSELNNWIDLIFGYKQTGKPALENCNLFSAASYEKKFKAMFNPGDPASFGLVAQAYHFGQTPTALFKKRPHVKRNDQDKLSAFEALMSKNAVKTVELEKGHEKNSSDGNPHAIFFSEKRVFIVNSKINNVYLVKFSLKPDKYLQKREVTLEYYYKCHKSAMRMTEISMILSDRKEIFYSQNSFTIYGKSLISAMHPSNSITIHNLKGKLLFSLLFHTNLVTCVASCHNTLISASLDSTMASWKPSKFSSFEPYLNYYGHNKPITHVSIIESYSLLVSANLAGVILIHDIRSSFCLKKISQSADCIGVSELGIIGVAGEGSVRYYGVNSEMIIEVKVNESAKAIVFNGFGEHCLEIYDSYIVFRDPTNDSRSYKVKLDSIESAVFDVHNKCVYCCRRKTAESSQLYIIKTASNN